MHFLALLRKITDIEKSAKLAHVFIPFLLGADVVRSATRHINGRGGLQQTFLLKK